MSDDKYMKVYDADDSNFEEVMKNILLYRKIVSVEQLGNQDAVLTLDNGVELHTFGNHGCPGCGNGWYYLKELNNCDNVITDVEAYSEGADEVYKLFVFADNKKINVLSYEGRDNGYYGTGYRIEAVLNES